MKKEELKIGMILADYGIDHNLKILNIEGDIISYNYWPEQPAIKQNINDFLKESLTDNESAIRAFSYVDGY